MDVEGRVDPGYLIQEASKAREAAYAPYSGFRVGACVMTPTGRVYTGCNIENALFGVTICAERVAIFKAVSCEERKFAAIAVVSDSRDICRPCGACRQVFVEFSPDMLVIMADLEGRFEVKKASELLPHPFQLSGPRTKRGPFLRSL